MVDVEIHIDLVGTVRPVGRLRRHATRRTETITFEYDPSWLKDANRFSIEVDRRFRAGRLEAAAHAARRAAAGQT